MKLHCMPLQRDDERLVYRYTAKCQQDDQGCIPDHAFTPLAAWHVAAAESRLCNARLVDEPQSSYL